MSIRLLALLLVLGCASACNAVPRVDVMPGYGSLDIDGELGVSDTGPAAEQQLSDLGIEGSEGALMGRAYFKWVGMQLNVSGLDVGYEGNGTTTGILSGDGNVIGVGANVNSELDIRTLTAALTYDVVPTDVFDLGLGLGVTLVDLGVSVTEVGTLTNVSGDGLLPLPTVSARASARLGEKFGVHGNVGWIAGEYGDFDGSLLDLDLFAEYRFLGGGERTAGRLALGYRLVDFSFDFDDGSEEFVMEFELTGPYLGLTFSF